MAVNPKMLQKPVEIRPVQGIGIKAEEVAGAGAIAGTEMGDRFHGQAAEGFSQVAFQVILRADG